MNHKKLIISALIIIVISFIGFLIGFLYKTERMVHLQIKINSEGQVPGISVLLDGSEVGVTDSLGYLSFEHEKKENATFLLTFRKPGFKILPKTKRIIAKSNIPELNYTLKVYPKVPPKLTIETKDWRGRPVPGAQILLNNIPMSAKTDQRGLLRIPLKDLPVGSLISLDARKNKMTVREGNEDIIIDGKKTDYHRTIILFQAPENWFEFYITDGQKPIKGVKIIRDGRIRHPQFNGKYYKDWVYDLNKKYSFVFRKTGYNELKRICEPSNKGKNEFKIQLEPLRFTIRVKDKSGLLKEMDNVIIYDRNNREIARTDVDGMAIDVPFPGLNRNFILKFEKRPDFPLQTYSLRITSNHSIYTVYINPLTYKRYIKLTWENGKPIKDAVVYYQGRDVGSEVLQGRPNKEGVVVLESYQIKPNRDYVVTLKTAFGKKEEADTPTEFMLKNKVPLKITVERMGQLTVRLENGNGKIIIKNALGNTEIEGNDEISKRILYGEYTIIAKNNTFSKKKHVSFYEPSKTITVNMTDPCDLLSAKIRNNPGYLQTSTGENEMDKLFDIIDKKANSGIALSTCEEDILRHYADSQYNNKEFFNAIEAYELLIKHVRGAKRKAVNFQRLGQANLYYAMTKNTIGLTEKEDRINASLKYFGEARLKVPTSVNRKDRRKFNTILFYDIAVATTYNYEIMKMKSESEDILNRYHKKALDAWDDFKYQYSHCNNTLKQELANLNQNADEQIEEIRNEE